MANQTVTTTVNFDSDSVLGLLDGETITINGGTITIDADNRWGQNAAVFGNITISSTLGGSVLIDGTKVWELPFMDGNGVVPELSSLDTNTLSGDSSLATGELFRVWASGSLEPLSAGTPMPSAGYVKLRTKTGNFQAGETVVLPGSAATFTTSTSGKRSWINVVGRAGTLSTGVQGQLTVPRLGSFNIQGDWYELGVTDGTDDQQIQLPLKEVCGGIQIETAPGSNTYEWWSNAGQKWFRETLGYDYQTSSSSSNLNIQLGTAIADPFNKALEGYEWNETTTNAVHRRLFVGGRSDVDRYTFSVYLKRDTRQYAMVQLTVDTSKKYSVLVNLDDGTATSTDDYNSPQNPSYNIIDAGNGWYKIEVSADHTSDLLVAQGGFGTSNSATPTLNATDRFPTFAGATTEGVFAYKPSLSAHTIEFFSDSDNRGKFFGMTDDGVITLAKRSDGSCGLKPVSGCKIRIPNVFLSNATPHDYSRNHVPGFVGRNPRYNFSTTAGGAINITKAASNWGNTFTGAYEVNYNDCSILDGILFSNTADRNRVLNCCIGTWSYQTNTPISISTNFTGSRIENTRASKCVAHSSGNVISMVQSNNTTIKNCRLDIVDSPNSNSTRGSVTIGNNPIVLRATGCDELLFENNQCIGGQHYIDQTTNSTFKNNEVAAFLNGNTKVQTTAIDPYFYFINSSANILVDGLSAFDNLQNVHPYGASTTGSAGLATISTYANNITIQNVGTPANPFYTGLSAGDINTTYCIGYMLGTTFNVTFRKVYCTVTRVRPFLTLNTAQTLLLENTGAKETLAANSALLACNNTLTKGAFFYNHGYAPQSSVYGTHWADFFKSSTEGQIVISCNEPLEDTLDQCNATFGGGGGFTSTGEISLVVPDQEQVIWTMPYYALGHTSLGYSVSSSNPPFATGSSSTTLQNHEFDYQIDTGLGFSDWKFLFGMRRRAGGGTAGGTTVTVDDITTNRAPSAGDFISSTGTTGGNATVTSTVALGTKITDYDPSTRVITVDTPFLANFASNEQVTYWRDIEDETINPNTGVKLKVRARPTTQNAANSLRFISIPTRTNETDYQIQFPTPVAVYTGQITNIVPNSRVQVYNLTKDNEVFNGIITGTTYSISYGEGNEFQNNDLIRARISFVDGLSAMKGFEAIAQASNGWSIFAQQEIDTVYNSIGIDGSTIGEFAADYPNVEVDVQDEDGTTSINRLYAWWVNNEYTAQGIREYFGGLLAEDDSNFRIITERVDLKLDNVESYGVQFVGDLRLFRDDGAAPVVSTTTGGGSIVLYAGKVYNVVTSQSGLTPSESAQIGSLSAIKINTDLIPGIV